MTKIDDAMAAIAAKSAASSHISDAVCDAALIALGQPTLGHARDWIRPAIAAALDAHRRQKLGGTPAKQALLHHMLWWSEDRYAASWLSHLEYAMAADEADQPDGEFRWLVTEAGGWWTFNDDWKPGDSDEYTFVRGTFDELLAKRSS